MEVTIAHPFPNILEAPIYSSSVLHGKALRDSIFVRCSLTDMRLINCFIMNTTLINSLLERCLLVNCELRGCSLVASSIKTSRIVNSTFTNSLRSKCHVTPTPPFNRIPLEIRAMVFSEVIEWKGKTPALIAALRGDPILYREALGVFRKTCTFTLHWDNEVTRKKMSQAAFQSIEKIRIM
jgi:hypothetical protein